MCAPGVHHCVHCTPPRAFSRALWVQHRAHASLVDIYERIFCQFDIWIGSKNVCIFSFSAFAAMAPSPVQLTARVRPDYESQLTSLSLSSMQTLKKRASSCLDTPMQKSVQMKVKIIDEKKTQMIISGPSLSPWGFGEILQKAWLLLGQTESCSPTHPRCDFQLSWGTWLGQTPPKLEHASYVVFI